MDAFGRGTARPQSWTQREVAVADSCWDTAMRDRMNSALGVWAVFGLWILPGHVWFSS